MDRYDPSVNLRGLCMLDSYSYVLLLCLVVVNTLYARCNRISDPRKGMPVRNSQYARAISVTSGIRRGWYSVRSPESHYRRVRFLAAPRDSQRRAFRRPFRKLPISTNGPCSTPLVRGCPRHSRGIRNRCSCPSPYLIGLLLLHIHYIRPAGKRQPPQKIYTIRDTRAGNGSAWCRPNTRSPQQPRTRRLA